MNKVILMGRLTRDVDTRYSQNGDGTAVSKYTLAVDRRGKKGETDFINVIAFGKAAEFSEKYLNKGTKVIVTGRIQTGSYTNKDGQKVYTTDVVAEDQEFAESKKANESAMGEINAPIENEEGFSQIPDNYEVPFAEPTR